MITTDDELLEDVKYWKGRFDALQVAFDEARAIIQGVVTSYPVAAGTSKYGHEPDHDGYGSIRECRIFLEKTPLTSGQGK